MTRKRGVNNEYTYKVSREHNHLVDVREEEVATIKAKAKKLAETSGKTTRDIIAEASAGASNEGLAQLGNYSALRNTLAKKRKDNLHKAPTDLNELEIPDAYKRTSSGDDFVLFDSGPGLTRIIMFSTQKNMDFLGTCSTLYMDGTFDVCPPLFNQVYVIHGNSAVFREPFLNRS